MKKKEQGVELFFKEEWVKTTLMLISIKRAVQNLDAEATRINA
jgi:hypothetical protein